MATTLLKLKELSQQTIEAIVKSPDAWKKYLNAAPNIFRYSFEDQLRSMRKHQKQQQLQRTMSGTKLCTGQ